VGGRVSLIDTDWSTLSLDVGDARITAGVRAAMASERRRPSHVGRRLDAMVRAAGFGDVVRHSATQRWTHWNPDETVAPLGCFSMASLAEDLVAADQLDHGDTQRFISTVHDAARRGNFSMSLTMFAVVGVLPFPHS
jgi:hypothetical protein